MNTLIRLSAIIMAAVASCSFTTAAQDTQQYDFSSVCINGLEIGKFYTREQYLEALGGQPHRESDDAYHFLIYQTTMALAPAADPELSDICFFLHTLRQVRHKRLCPGGRSSKQSP